MTSKKVAIVMGSTSDYSTMHHAEKMLERLAVESETLVISAHRTPERLYKFAKNASDRGIKVIIAGAGGAAHLPGMVASMSELPVLGVPIEGKVLHGIDSLLSICQMPSGTPVGTLSIGKAGAENAALLACKILALNDKEIRARLQNWIKQQSEGVPEKPQEPLK